MDGGRQLKLLLWKDYLTRKRKLITVGGILWASGIMFALYIVRLNVDNEDSPACQFPARALPSAGVMNFLQSFICSVNNECSAMDKYEEIPTYEKSKLTQLQRKLSPLMNETVLDIAASVPDALKLLSTLADILDQPTFIDFTRRGLRVEDLFNNPTKVKKYISTQLNIADDVSQSLMASDINFQGILNGKFSKCNAESLSKVLVLNNNDTLQILVTKLCSMSDDQIQTVSMGLLMEVNFSKYIKMFGSMYFRLTGDNRLTQLGDMLTSIVRMINLRNFLPAEVANIIYGDTEFSYFPLSLISKLMSLFEPTFRETQSFKSLKDFTDGAVTGLQYLDKMFTKPANDSETIGLSNIAEGGNIAGSLRKITKLINNAVNALEDTEKNQTINVFSILSRVMTFANKFLPDNQKHDVLFYSTLLAKLMESAGKVIDINTHLEKITYDVALRHPDGVKILVSLPPYVIGKTFEAIADTERVQLLSSKINHPGQLFCDTYKLAMFFVVSATEADSLRKMLCNDTWKNYVSDLIKSFGVFDVRLNVNNMASLLIQETLGQDTSDQLYTIEKDFEILENLTKSLQKLEIEKRPDLDWAKVFNVSDDSEFMKVVKQKAPLGKQMLITIHGAIAKEIVKQNPILEYKISSVLLHMETLVAALNEELAAVPSNVTLRFKNIYGEVLETVLRTALNEEKTYKSLSTYYIDIFCNGADNAEQYLEFPTKVNRSNLLSTVCESSTLIVNGLKNTSVVAKAIKKISNTSHNALESVNWTRLINSIKQLYIKLQEDYPYLFDYASYGLDELSKSVIGTLRQEAKMYWFSVRNIPRTLHLSIKLGLRFLDFLDHGIFDITNPTWLQMKYYIKISTGPLNVFDDTVKFITALFMRKNYTTELPQITVQALHTIVSNLPQLMVDSVNIIVKGDTDINPIITIMNTNPAWPCSDNSISELLEMTPSSKDAIASLERLLCLKEDLQMEWVAYLEKNKAFVPKRDNFNSTRFVPYVFLNISRTFDSLIDDTTLVKEAFQYIVNDKDVSGLSILSAWEHTIKAVNTTDKKIVIRKFLNKVDSVLNAIDTSTVDKPLTLHKLWENYFECSNTTYIDEKCRDTGRAAWKYSLRTLSVIFDNIAMDLLTYFTEINEPDFNILQWVGFTKGTGLYTLYDRIGNFISVLLNSYWDYDFMNQIRRAILTRFWDCEAVMSALKPAPDSPVDSETIKRIQPILCPKLLYWLSMPRNENKFFDLVAKPQYYLYTYNVQNVSSNYESFFTKMTQVIELLSNNTIDKKFVATTEQLQLPILREKLTKFVDTILNFQIHSTDSEYKVFVDVYKKQFAYNIYLTRIVAMVNKLSTAINNFNIDESLETEDKDLIKKNFVMIRNMYRKRTVDMIFIHFDAITSLLWNDKENHTLVDSLIEICNDIEVNNTEKYILADEKRTKIQFCATSYKEIYSVINNAIVDDYANAKKSLDNIINFINNDANITDIFAWFKRRKRLVVSLKSNIQYAYDIGLPTYLKYLHYNLQSYDIILKFMSGEDWWTALKKIYNGPYVGKLFTYAEKSFEAAENILTNIDRIHLVRLLRDINLNDSSTFCQPNITISDYVPDSTGILSNLKQQECAQNELELYREIPSLLIASQNYEPSLRLGPEVNYTSLYADLDSIEALLEIVNEGPKDPQRPIWVTEERIARLRTTAVGLLSKETLTKIGFGVLGNIVDAGTLFMNNSQCTLCSQFTTWFKQLNLQLYKKDEYNNLLCHMDTMTLEEIYHNLKNNFHWDMAIEELISLRNYTKYELNKSMNEFLELVKLHLLQDMTSNSSRLMNCLANKAVKNALGQVSLFIHVLSHTARLFRAELPHIREVVGIKDLPFLKQLSTEITHNLNVMRPLKLYLKDKNTLNMDLINEVPDSDLLEDIEESEINLRATRNVQQVDDLIKLKYVNWQEICEEHNCSVIASKVRENLNLSLVEKDLPKYQRDEFWRFTFISNIVGHIENILSHGARVLEVTSALDIKGAVEGKLESLIDLLMTVLIDENNERLIKSLEGFVEEFHPLLKGTDLDTDLNSLAVGLNIFHQFKNYLLEEEDLKLEAAKLFRDPVAIEMGLNALGINNTNFWSLAAPRLNNGFINLKPLFSNQKPFHIKDFVCQIEHMAPVLLPSNLDVVTNDEVLSAVTEQFCGIDDLRAKQIVSVLLQNFNISIIIEKVTGKLLNSLYTASDLTEQEGATVMSKFPQMTALIPVMQQNVGCISNLLAEEPLLQSLKDFTSVGNLVTSSDFMKNAGNMLCGKKFNTNIPRILTNILNNKDNSGGPTEAQLNAFPTDFCRSLYKDIVSVEGGKIVWSFVKPLIMGKILYAPINPIVNNIIEKANDTFASMIRMTSLVHSFAKAFPSLNNLLDHRGGVEALISLATSPNFEQLRSMIIGDDIQIPDMDLEGLFDQIGDIKGLGGILKKASDLLQCFNLNRFRGTQDEHQLTHEAAQLTMANEFSAGIVFLNTDMQNASLSNIEYKIRMDIENVPTTSRKIAYLWTPGPESNFIENMRYFRGFVQIQDMIDSAIIKLSRNSTRRRKRDTHAQLDWASYTQQIPYPCYRNDFYQTSLYESQTLLVGFFFSLLFTVASVVRYIVIDKETGNTMLMSVMGVNLSYHTLSWFLSSFLEMTVTVGCMTLVLHYGMVIPRTDPTLIFALLFIFGLSVLSFCYMMSKMFSSASFAAVCTAIAYLTTFMPYVMILSLEAVMVSSLKLLVCFFMSSSLCYAFLFIARYEAMGSGAQWTNLWSSPIGSEDMNIGLAAIMIMVDAFIYFAIGCLIDRYFGIKSIRSNITNCTTTEEKAGVNIINVTKVYAKGTRREKVALDNVSIELRKGQITTLLGHNGAGKTTLINILTGMLKPTSGHVVIRSDNESGTRLGMCPQRDVLFYHMTAREHVQFYAQLKSGLPADEVSDEVEKMLQVLSLGPWSDELVLRLSGGTRRRLCVALAFIAKPHLVSLDEPTSGVDPAARRDIWSMIVKLKEDRTILLTTHHLDEAELLSDQILIMHKGQIHTTGSPIEIKRALGNGYKLTAFYPERRSDECIEDASIEEKTKQLLAVIRDVVKNANVSDMNGLEVEISLPFFDPEGLNNDFLRLCTVLESSQALLGYKSFSMDCSSLEQVFFDICQQADGTEPQNSIKYAIGESPTNTSKSASTSSIRADHGPLVPPEGPLRGTWFQQFLALMRARYIHHMRNRWLMFLLVVLPTLFVTVAMGFSMLRPPADNEISLKLNEEVYNDSTQFLVPQPSMSEESRHISTSFAQHVMDYLQYNREVRNWTVSDSPTCRCLVTRQVCDVDPYMILPEMMSLPDVDTLNSWLLDSQEVYIEKRYGGFTSTLKNNITNFITWYNNKGHHALPAYLNVMNTAILRAAVGDDGASITVYTHPLKISNEKLSKATVYQRVADAGISCLILVAYSLISAGAAIYLVNSRRSQQKRLQLLCGVSPGLYWGTALVWDMIIILFNMVVTAIVLLAFGYSVFVARNNLPAICVLIILYGYACGNLIHIAEKLFNEASLANMMLFCGNTIVGLFGITTLLILDIISESEATDNARWILHKIFMVSPQFALGDGLLEIAKNTIQAQVLLRFDMDTYRDPFTSDLMVYHYSYLVVVGTLLLLLNLAIEYDYFEVILVRLRRERVPEECNGEMEPLEVTAERRRVREVRAQAHHVPLRVSTLGNINRGFVPTECKKNSIQRILQPFGDVAQCVDVGKAYPAASGQRVAVRSLTLGVPAGQCTALLGQNGAGKSTTFAMLTGEVRPTVGQIYLNDDEVDPRKLCQGLISYCPQSDAIDPLLTVRETLQFYCRLRGITDENTVMRRTLDMFDLSKYADVLSKALSGGNKRKLCTAIAFMGRTPLVLLDEPTSGMDPASRVCVSRGVQMCVRGSGGLSRGCPGLEGVVQGARGVLVSTHALDDARRIASRVALMRKGELVALASLDDCLNRFGGGHVVQCRTRRSDPRVLWRHIRSRAPHASLRILHHDTLHFLLPTFATVGKKEIETRLSDIFRLMAELQATCDIEDYTINQSSLEQMFLSFTDKGEMDYDPIEMEPLPAPDTLRGNSEEVDSITSL